MLFEIFKVFLFRFKPELNTKKWKEENDEGSGIIYDLGAHIIDQVIALFGFPKKVWGQTFTQRKNSAVNDAFDIKLDYEFLKVTLRSSLLVREQTPRYIIHGTKASFIKYGLDLQEEHLKAGMQPSDICFGVEPSLQDGIFYSENGDEFFTKKIASLPGNWALLFENLYEAIAEGKELIIDPKQVVEQIKIIEAVSK